MARASDFAKKSHKITFTCVIFCFGCVAISSTGYFAAVSQNFGVFSLLASFFDTTTTTTTSSTTATSTTSTTTTGTSRTTSTSTSTITSTTTSTSTSLSTSTRTSTSTGTSTSTSPSTSTSTTTSTSTSPSTSTSTPTSFKSSITRGTTTRNVLARDRDVSITGARLNRTISGPEGMPKRSTAGARTISRTEGMPKRLTARASTTTRTTTTTRRICRKRQRVRQPKVEQWKPSKSYALHADAASCGFEGEFVGNVSSIEECAATVRASSNCNHHFMFSIPSVQLYNKSECFCCMPEDLIWPLYAKNWSIFKVLGRLESRFKGPPPSGVPTLFPLVQSVKVSGPCCSYLAADVLVLVVGRSGKSSPLLRRAAIRAQQALRRIAKLHTAVRDTTWMVHEIQVSLQKDSTGSELLNENSDLTYSIIWEPPLCIVRATGVFGVVAALESTLRQLVAHGGEVRSRSVKILDWPEHRVRGLMVDAGRRFVPKSVLLSQVINAMALVRMNFLHLHLSDFCRFAIDLPDFPELRPTGFRKGQYTIKDVKEIVAYAHDRGIRVVPEIDLPAHAQSLLPLKAKGMQFCEPFAWERQPPERATTIYDDPWGKSRRVLRKLLAAIADAFGKDERWFHVGGDEAQPRGSCTTLNIVYLENYVIGDIVGEQLNRTAIAWGELRLREKEEDGVRAAGGRTETIVTPWTGDTTPRQVTDLGHPVIMATIRRHYLDFSYKQHPPTNFWYDPRQRMEKDKDSRQCRGWVSKKGVYIRGDVPNMRDQTVWGDPERVSLKAAQQLCGILGTTCHGVTCDRRLPSHAACEVRRGERREVRMIDSAFEDSWLKACPDKNLDERFLGSISAMWTDRYCYIYQCGAAYPQPGSVRPNANLMFAREFDASFGKSLAGMIWPRAAMSAAAYWKYSGSIGRSRVESVAAWIASFLRDVGNVSSCPPGCECDELSACGKPYEVVSSNLSELGLDAMDVCFCSGQEMDLTRPLPVPPMPRKEAMRYCYWSSLLCAGVMCQVPIAGNISNKKRSSDHLDDEDVLCLPYEQLRTNATCIRRSTKANIFYLPKNVDGITVLSQEGVDTWVANKSKLVADKSQMGGTRTAGLAYRLSKNTNDKDSRKLLLWGDRINGTDEGDGWIKIEQARTLNYEWQSWILKKFILECAPQNAWTNVLWPGLLGEIDEDNISDAEEEDCGRDIEQTTSKANHFAPSTISRRMPKRGNAWDMYTTTLWRMFR